MLELRPLKSYIRKMIRLNRSTEYALIALRYIQKSESGKASAREISDRFGLPFEITAKTLQRLKDLDWIRSTQGARGGYTLGKDLSRVTLAEFLDKMEGPQAVVGCCESPGACEYLGQCEIRGPMKRLNSRVRGFLEGIRLSELTGDSESGLGIAGGMQSELGMEP